MRPGADVVLPRLRPLPPRLRIAHLAALLRVARAANAGPYPSPAERVGRVAAAKRWSGGGANVLAKAQLLRLVAADPHTGSPSLADPPRKGEGSTDGRAG